MMCYIIVFKCLRFRLFSPVLTVHTHAFLNGSVSKSRFKTLRFTESSSSVSVFRRINVNGRRKLERFHMKTY